VNGEWVSAVRGGYTKIDENRCERNRRAQPKNLDHGGEGSLSDDVVDKVGRGE